MARQLDENLRAHRLWLCGIKVSPASATPELFTLQHEVNEYWPLVSAGRVVFFSRLSLASAALSMDDDIEVRKSQFPPIALTPTRIHDLVQVRHILETKDEDEGAQVLNLLNALDDFLLALKVDAPDPHKNVLDALAQHLTFEPTLRAFFSGSPHQRQDVVDGLSWCLGAILLRSTILT